MSYTDKSICLWPGCLSRFQMLDSYEGSAAANSVVHALADGDRGIWCEVDIRTLEGTGSSVGTAEGSAEARCSSSSSFSTSSSSLSSSDDSLS
ncbi:hypothetical protein Tco_1408049 [Tanacetum coccineum]